MTNTTQAAEQQTRNAAEMPDIPASLKRKPVGPTTGTMKDAAAAIAAKHNKPNPDAIVAKPATPSSAVLRDALKGAAAKVVARTTGTAKVVGKLAAKPVKAKAAHKPTTIARTDDNPAKSIVPAKFKAVYAEHNDTNGAKLNLTLKS